MKIGSPAFMVNDVPHTFQPMAIPSSAQQNLESLFAGHPVFSAWQAAPPRPGAPPSASAPQRVSLAIPRSLTEFAPPAPDPQPPSGPANAILGRPLSPEIWLHPLPVVQADAATGLGVVETLLDAIPFGTPVPTAVDAVAAVVASVDLWQQFTSPRKEGESLDHALLYSASIVDIATLVTDLVPALKPAGMPLSVLSLILKTGNQIRTYSLTPAAGVGTAFRTA